MFFFSTIRNWFAKTKERFVSLFRRKKLPLFVPPTEKLNKEAIGVKAFETSLIEYNKLFVMFMHNVAIGRGSYGETSTDFYANGAIGIGVTLANTFLAGVSIAGFVSGYLSLGIGFGLWVVGALGTFAFSCYRNRVKNHRLERAETFFDNKKMDVNIHFLKSKIANQFANQLNHCSEKEGKKFAREVHKIIIDAILHAKAKTLHALFNNKFLALYQSKAPVITAKSSTKKVLEVVGSGSENKSIIKQQVEKTATPKKTKKRNKEILSIDFSPSLRPTI